MGAIQINFSNWSDKYKTLGAKYDNDGIEGLSSIELFNFVKDIKNGNVDTVSISAKSKKLENSSFPGSIPPELQEAVNYFNDNVNIREMVVSNTYTNGERILHDLTADIDEAYNQCDAYNNITLVPRKWFRWYRPVEFVNFDLNEIQKDAENNIKSINELQNNIQKAFDKAHGIPEDEHKTPEEINIDMEAMAQKYLGMSYEDFVKEYKNELEQIKTITNAQLNSPDTPQRLKDAHYKAQQYAYALTQEEKTIMRDMRTDSGYRELQESFEYGDDMTDVEMMKDSGITKESLAEITSPIMYQAFTQALQDIYNELNGIKNPKENNKKIPDKFYDPKTKQIIIKGQYTIDGKKIK